MHCLSNVLVIQWLLSTADAHTPSRSRSRYIGIWHICLQHGRRTHRRLTRRAGRATPLWHSSPGVCGCAGEREGVFSAMQCIGHGTQRRSNVLATPAPPHPSPGCGHTHRHLTGRRPGHSCLGVGEREWEGGLFAVKCMCYLMCWLLNVFATLRLSLKH